MWSSGLLAAAFQSATRLRNGSSKTPREKFPPPLLTLIPSYPDLPMEKVYARQSKTDIAQVFLREVRSARRVNVPSARGSQSQEEFFSGRVIYFPWDIDRTFWEVLCVDHFKLLRNAVEWATNEPPVVQVTGPGVLDVTVWRQKNSITVHLVNLTNPMMMKGPLREFIPIGEQRVRLRLPNGIRPKRVHLLAAGKTVRANHTGEFLTITVSSILDHEVIAIDL